MISKDRSYDITKETERNGRATLYIGNKKLISEVKRYNVGYVFFLRLMKMSCGMTLVVFAQTEKRGTRS